MMYSTSAMLFGGFVIALALSYGIAWPVNLPSQRDRSTAYGEARPHFPSVTHEQRQRLESTYWSVNGENNIGLHVQETSQPDEEEINLRKHVKGLYHGDIKLTEDQQREIEALNEEEGEEGEEGEEEDASKQAMKRDIAARWPKGIVPYILDSSLNEESINAIYDAMDEFKKHCITFVDNRFHVADDYIKFVSGAGCWSYVGRVGGEQKLSVANTDAKGNSCAVKGIVEHEIFHALGRFHEQNRPDRDWYVQIEMDNIIPGARRNFDKESWKMAKTYRLPYDYESIMHYGPHTFAIDPTVPTISSKKSGKTISGQRDHLTELDIKHLEKSYCNS